MSYKSLLSLFCLLGFGERDLKDITDPKRVAEARALQKWPQPQTKIIVKKDKVKGNYLNKLVDPFGLKLLEL